MNLEQKFELYFGDLMPFGINKFEKNKGTISINNGVVGFLNIESLKIIKEFKNRETVCITLNRENIIKLKENIDLCLKYIDEKIGKK